MVSTRNVLLWLHIVAAMVTLGPLILFDVVGPLALRAGNTHAARFLEGITSKIGPATVAIPVLGLALVGEGGYELKDRWVIASLVMYAIMVGNGVGILGKAVSSGADRIDAGEAPTAELATLRLFGAINIVLFLGVLWLMVAKPGS